MQRCAGHRLRPPSVVCFLQSHNELPQRRAAISPTSPQLPKGQWDQRSLSTIGAHSDIASRVLETSQSLGAAHSLQNRGPLLSTESTVNLQSPPVRIRYRKVWRRNNGIVTDHQLLAKSVKDGNHDSSAPAARAGIRSTGRSSRGAEHENGYKFVSVRRWSSVADPDSPAGNTIQTSSTDHAQSARVKAKNEHDVFAFQLSYLWAKKFKGLRRHGKHASRVTTNKCREIALRKIQQARSDAQVEKAWTCFTTIRSPKYQIWQDIMLCCLKRSPSNALKLLASTMRYSAEVLTDQIIVDCLENAARHLQTLRGPARRTMQSSLMKLFSQYSNHASSAPDYVAFLLLQLGSSSKVLNTALESPATFNANTLLQVLQATNEREDIGTTLKVLRAVVRSGYDTTSLQLQSACVRLLRTPYHETLQYKVQNWIATEMLEMGIRPGLALYNVLILNAIEGEDHDTAWKMFHMMKTKTMIRPDATTYSILLRRATFGASAPKPMEFIREIRIDPRRLLQSQPLLFDALCTIRREKYPYPFRPSLDLFLEYCGPKPLRDLGIVDEQTRASASRPSEIQRPSVPVLRQMVYAFLTTCTSSTSPKKVYDVYSRYRQLLIESHPFISQLEQTEHVANAFILAFGRYEETVQHCPTIIREMLEAVAKKEASRLQARSGEGDTTTDRTAMKWRNPCKPTVRTWSMVAASYFRHRNKSAGERVLRMMQDRGLEYDASTWDAVVNGYATVQDIEGTVDTVKDMKSKGFPLSINTMRALGKVWDQARLLKALDGVYSDDDQESQEEPESTSSEEEPDSQARKEDWEALNAPANNVGYDRAAFESALQNAGVV